MDFKTCSSVWQRTHNSCFNSTPAAAADFGSNISVPSTRAHTSSLAVASARIETIADVRPDDGGPKTSVIAPRGSPPVSASSGAIPVGTRSKTRRSISVKGVGIRTLKADSNRARRITDCINKDRDRFSLYRTFVQYVNGRSSEYAQAHTTNR